MTKALELRRLDTSELQRQLAEAYQELFNLRFQKATRQLSNDRRIPYVKRTVAKIRTILRERELGISAEPAQG